MADESTGGAFPLRVAVKGVNVNISISVCSMDVGFVGFVGWGVGSVGFGLGVWIHLLWFKMVWKTWCGVFGF